jgi:hypothetical protein
MSLPKTATEYAEMTERAIAAGARAARENGCVDIWVGEMIALSNLTGAAATLEAARLMGPTPEDHARLDALMPKPPCDKRWKVGESVTPGWAGKHDADEQHRCIYPAGHEKEEPHYCRCGAEL